MYFIHMIGILIKLLLRKMEYRQSKFGRSVQRMRSIPGSSYVGTRNPSMWCCRNIRHERTILGASLTFYPNICEKNRRLAPGKI